MKLYVWDGVIPDYHPGSLAALAEDLRQARAVVEEGYRRYCKDIGGTPEQQVLNAIGAERPNVYAGPEGFVFPGGG
jgi:hypothetical protein